MQRHRAGSQSLPFCSLQVAADLAGPGDTVHVLSVRLYGDVVVRRSGAPGAPVTFVGDAEPTAPPLLTSLTIEGAHDVVVRRFQIQSNLPGRSQLDIRGSQRIDAQDLVVRGLGLPSASVDPGVVSVEGASSDVTLTRSRVLASTVRPEIHVSAGAQRVAITADTITGLHGSGIVLDDVSGAVVTNDSLVAGVCGPAIAVSDAGSASVENTFVRIKAPDAGCTSGTPTGLGLAAGATATVTADHNAFDAAAGAVEYAWKGTTYTTTAAFHAATGQGAHDLEGVGATLDPSLTPVEGSPLVDSGDAAAPGLPSTDLKGNPRVDDPLVADTGTGHVDRGAFELQDPIGLAYTTGSRSGAAPLSTDVTVTSAATGPWHEAVTYTVDFGDSGGAVDATSGVGAPHVYSAPGVYRATITASNTGGSRETSRPSFTVAPAAAPTAAFAVVPGAAALTDPGIVDVRVTPDGDPSWIVDYSVAWGDGTRGSVAAGTVRHEYGGPGSFTAVLTVTDVLGRTTTRSLPLVVGQTYHPVTPRRILSRRLAAHATVTFSTNDLKARIPGVPAGLAVTVSAAHGQRGGSLTLVPRGTTVTRTTTLAYAAGQSLSTLAVVTGGADVTLANTGSGFVDVAVDGVGAFSSGAGGDSYTALSPRTVVDTRRGIGAPKAPLGAGRGVTVQVAGTGGVPANATAVVLDLTATGTRATGRLVAYAHGTSLPAVTSVSWLARRDGQSLAVVPLKDGKVVLSNQSSGTIGLVGAVLGYYAPTRAGAYATFQVPRRILDTRTGLGARRAKLAAGATLTLRVPGTGIRAVAGRLILVNAAAGGTVAAGPTAGAPVSSVAYAKGAVSARLLLVPVGPSGVLVLRNTGRTPVDVVLDVSTILVSAPGT